MTWRHFLHYWSFVKGIHWSLVDCLRKPNASSDVTIVVILNRLLNKSNKQASWRWFETPRHPCDVTLMRQTRRTKTVKLTTKSEIDAIMWPWGRRHSLIMDISHLQASSHTLKPSKMAAFSQMTFWSSFSSVKNVLRFKFYKKLFSRAVMNKKPVLFQIMI